MSTLYGCRIKIKDEHGNWIDVGEIMSDILKADSSLEGTFTIDESHTMKPEEWGKVVTLDPSEYTSTDKKR